MNQYHTRDREKIRRTIGGGLGKNMAAEKTGARAERNRDGVMTEEGKRHDKVMSLQTKMHAQMTDLGARIYSLMGARTENPSEDARVKDIVIQIKKAEGQIAALTENPVFHETAGPSRRFRGTR